MNVKDLIKNLVEMPMELEVQYETRDNSLEDVCDIHYNKVLNLVVLR